MANIAEDVPDTIDEGVVEIARKVVTNGDRKPAVQAIRLSGAVEDVESRELIEDRMEGGHNNLMNLLTLSRITSPPTPICRAS